MIQWLRQTARHDPSELVYLGIGVFITAILAGIMVWNVYGSYK